MIQHRKCSLLCALDLELLMEEEVEGAKLIIEEKVEHQLSCSISSFEFIVLRGLSSIFCPLRSFVVYFFVDPYLKYKKDKIIGVT